MYYHNFGFAPRTQQHPYGRRNRFGVQAAAVNIRETEKDYQLHFVAPGRNKEDFKLNVSGDVLTVSYQTKQEENTTNDWLHSEYHLDSFKRSFRVNENVDQTAISARYDNGILVVTLPKKEEAKNQPLDIVVA